MSVFDDSSRGGKIMYQVAHKVTGEIRTVYGMNGPRFIFWHEEEKCWVYDDMDNYRPAE